jgi:hypothetical protein
MFEYPSVVSRTLDPTGKSLLTVVGLHDHEISDADVNLIQDLQRSKVRQLLADGPATSGCLTWKPFSFDTTVANTFAIPQFDVLFNGEPVTIAGSLSADVTLNNVVLPAPIFWNIDTGDDPARIYVVFLELWYQSLDPTTGVGYYQDLTTGLNYFYPYGCVTPAPSLLESMPDDSVDIFNQGLYTTQRAQIQWRLNVQRVSLTYNFGIYRYGLDPSGTGTIQAVYAQASQSQPVTGSTVYQFTNMGTVSGDTGLWQAGDGDPTNMLGTMDGYSYAMPVAVVFQRNWGGFSLANNIFGCGNPQVPDSGLLASDVSGRFDSRLADQIYEDDTVDTRQTVSLDGWDYEKLTGEGLTDLITGDLHAAIGRGQSPGMSPTALGSTLDYYVSMSSSAVTNTNTVGAFDGFSNGFSSDLRTYYATQRVTINMKSVGTNGAAWAQNDAFTISLPTNVASAKVTITSAFVQGFNSPTPSQKVPINLLSGQILISGLNASAITVSFPYNLVGTAFDPGANNLYVTLGVTYPAGSNTNLIQTPFAVDGGTLYDATTSITLPVYGVSEYDIQDQQLFADAATYQLWAFNPEYSSVAFGTRIWVEVPGSSGVGQTVAGSPSTTFIVNRLGINGNYDGLYVVSAWDEASGNVYSISSVSISGGNCIVTVQGAVSSTSTVIMSFMAKDTAQVAFNAPVKGITEIEETVLMSSPACWPAGTASFNMDPRVTIEAVSYNSTTKASTVVLAGNGCTIKGISGNDTTKVIWILGQPGTTVNAVTISLADFNNGLVTVTVTNIDLTSYPNDQFFFVGSILPALDPDSVLTLEERYVPYQGEGVTARNYEVLYTADNALVTSNGTGAAPQIGLSDVYPYNRQYPIILSLPKQVNWSDATLTNTPLSTMFDNNYVAMRQNNVETTFEVPLHTNDFILPMNKDIRKQIQLVQSGSGGRGFPSAVPHVGFAITAPTARTVLGQNLQSTIAPIVLYVNNVSGNDGNSGLDPADAKLTITGAIATLPPVLRHPCSIQLVSTNVPYSISNLSSSLQVIALGDGTYRTAKWYALANLAFSIQEEGRIVITTTTGATAPAVIDATGWAGFGDGPTSAFFIDNSRALFNNIQFQGFTNPAVYGIDSDVEFVGCMFLNNAQAGGFEQGCGVILTGGSINLPTSGNGFVLSQSELTVSGMALTVLLGVTPGTFFTAERSSCLNLSNHAAVAGQETDISAGTVVAYAQLNSNIVADSSFQTAGQAILTANSVLSRSATIDPFLGGITVDKTSSVVTQL